MFIEIDTFDRRLCGDLLGTSTVSAGASVLVPGGGALVFEGAVIRKAVGIPETLEFLFNCGKDVAVGLFSAWLYDRLRGRAVRLRVNRIEVELDGEAIKRVLIEQIEIEK